MSLNYDSFIGIIEQSEYPDVLNLCKTNPTFARWCKESKQIIFKTMFNKYQIDYKDPTNFIYVMNKINMNKVKTIIKSNDFKTIFKLYLKFYQEQSINCAWANITSIPIYPRLKLLECNNNQITTLPVMPKLETLNCDNNQITTLPVMPKLITLSCDNNQITTLPVMPALKILYCYNNQITTLPIMPALEVLDCDDNQITTLPVMPRLKTLSCRNNQITTLPVMPKLKRLDCRNNQITKLPVMPRLKHRHLNILRHVIGLTCASTARPHYH